MKSLLLIAIASLSLSVFAVQVKDDGRHITYIMAASDFNDQELNDAVEESITYAIGEMKKIIPDNRITRSTLNQARKIDKDQISDIIDDIQILVESDDEGFRFRDLIPSAYMFLVSGKVSANLAIGAGLSGTIGLVVSPTYVIKIDKVSGKVQRYYTARASVVFFPHVSVGGGVGGGLSTRYGIGLIFGNLQNPDDIEGWLGAASGTLAVGGGLSIKGGIIMRDDKSPLFFGSGMFSIGAEASASIHGNVGGVWNLKNLREKVMGQRKTDRRTVRVNPDDTNAEILRRIRNRRDR